MTWSNHYGFMCITFYAVAIRIQFVIFFVLKMVKQVKIINDSVFAKRVLTYWGNRGSPGYSYTNVLIVPIENYTFILL